MIATLWVLLGLLVAAAVWIVTYLSFSLVNGVRNAYSVGCPHEALAEIVGYLEASERSRLIDVGCGDGRVMAAWLSRFSDTSASGVENNPAIWLAATARLRRFGGRATVILANLAATSDEQADRVFMYLSPRMMGRLEPGLSRLYPRARRLASLQFPLPEREPTRVIKLRHGRPHASTLYVYDLK